MEKKIAHNIIIPQDILFKAERLIIRKLLHKLGENFEANNEE